eukprot:191534_1
MSTEVTILSLTEIPEEIIIHMCNFLCLMDLLKLELSCKHLLKLSKSPNAITKLHLPNKYYSANDTRFSRIKCLDICRCACAYTANPNWKISVNELRVDIYCKHYIC